MNEVCKDKILCYITDIEPTGNLLKVCFQRDTQASLLVESHLNNIIEEIQFGPYTPKKYDELTAGLICFGKFEDGKFYRVKIIGCSKNGINVLFIDYGNEATLDITDIRVNNQNSDIRDLLSVSPLASSAYVKDVVLVKQLTNEELINLKQNLLYTNKLCTLTSYTQSISLIEVSYEKRNLSHFLIDSGFGTSITDTELLQRIQKMMKPTFQDSQRSGRSLVSHRLQVRNKTAQPEFPSQKSVYHYDERQNSSNSLAVGSSLNGYITHIEDGPYSFTVQLKNHSEEIQSKIDAICDASRPRLNTDPLFPGSHILGRSRHENIFKRAVAMIVKANACKVYYMDYGVTDELPQSEIYVMPPIIRDLAQPQAVAFCLADLQSLNLPESCKDVFAKLVLNKQILLRVTQNEFGSLAQSCELFLDGKNVREMLLNITSPLEYTNQFPPRGREIAVNVSFVDCPTQFFVQYHSEIHILGMIQDSLSAFCPHQERLQSMYQISIGTPIGSLYSIDNMWYRALVIGFNDDTVNVLYVDYGNRDNVRIEQLCHLSRELVTKWRSQAVECCLVGFENATPDALLALEMENRVLGGHFTLKLQYLLGGNRLVVDLIDENGGSVVKMMNDLAKASSSSQITDYNTSNLPSPKFASSNAYGVSLTQSVHVDVDQNRGYTGDGGGGAGAGGGERRNRNTGGDYTRFHERQFNKYSEHDDRLLEDYEDNRYRGGGAGAAGGGALGGGDKYKKKWEDRNGSKWREEGSNWRDESRRNEDSVDKGSRYGASNDWDGSKGKDRSERSGRGDRSGGERSNRFGGGERSGRFNDAKRCASGKYDNDDEKFNERNEKFKCGDRKGFGGGDRGNRYSNRDEDEEKTSEHSGGDERRYGGSYERSGGGGSGGRFGERGSRGGDRNDRGGQRKYSADNDNKYGDRKFGDRGDKGGGKGGGKFGGGDRFNRSRDRDQGDRGGSGRRNADRSYDSFSSKIRETSKSHSTSNDEFADTWDEPSSSTTQITCAVGEYPNLNVVAGESYSVYFSVMGSEPNDVYVQMEDSVSHLDELREQTIAEESLIMTNTSSRAVPKELLTPGLPVLARFDEDQLLYRAVVRNHTASMVTVLFVDYGNCAQVKLSELYTVTPALATKPVQALRVMLTDIKPTSEKWPSDFTSYSPYYENDILKLQVNILKCINGEIVCIGSLTRIDGKTVSQKLIEDGLAFPASDSTYASTSPVCIRQPPSQDTIPQVPSNWIDNLDLLVGQTLYAVFIKEVDKNTFILKISAADLTIVCQFDDDRKLSNISPDTKVIVLVTGVEEIRLLLSMFDYDGKQLGESDTPGATISLICPMPIVKKTDLVYISHFNGEIVFIQNASSSHDLTILLELLYERYNSSVPEENVQWEIDMFCCALSSDANWYRAKIVDIREKYTVMFIDYGNTEIVDSEQLRKIDPEFFIAELSLGARLPVEWLVPEPPLMDYVIGEKFNCIIRKDDKGFWIVDLTFISTGEKLVKKLIDNSLAKEIEFVSTDDKTLSEVSSLKAGDSVPVVISHVDSPVMFWAQLCSHLSLIEDLQQKLQDCIVTMPPPSENCKIFAAKYSEDNIWYRAVGSGDGDNVRFIDYGNTDPAPIRKELPKDFYDPQEGYAIAMQLPLKQPIECWSTEAVKVFETFIEQQITAEIVKIDKKRILVDLKSSDQSLTKLLIEANHATYIEETLEPSPVSQESIGTSAGEVYVLAIVDVNNFYVQLISQSDQQIEMMENLAKADDFEMLERCNIGDLIVAKYSLDDQWYRAKITSLNPLKALFVDYGNVCDIINCRELPDHLRKQPPMAIHCSLNLEKKEEYTEKFAILTSEPTMVFNLIYKSEGEPNIVELELKNGQKISDYLLTTAPMEAAGVNCVGYYEEEIYPGCVLKNCIVCHANGPYDFYIQTPSAQAYVELLNDKMVEAAQFPEVDKLDKGDTVAVLSSEHVAWYRCKIVDVDPEIGGYFIDYGNGTLVTECRRLPDEIKCVPPLAVKCSLQLPDGIGGWSADAVLTFTELVNEDTYDFDVVLLAEGDPWVVELIANDSTRCQVTQELLKLCSPATPVPSKPATRTASPIVSDLEPSATGEPTAVSHIKSPDLPGTESMENTSATLTQSTPKSGRCYITHVNSLEDFFVRDINTCTDLEKIALALTELESNPKEKPYNVGDIAVAQIEGEYFRAKIMEINPLKVSLIDVGNTSETSTLLQVPDSIKNIPPKAINCRLHVPAGLSTLSKKTKEEFIIFTLNGNVEFDYRMFSEQGDRAEIELSINGESLIDVLNANLNKTQCPKKENEMERSVINEQQSKYDKCLKITIPYMKSLEEFYIQETVPEMEIISDKLADAATFKSLTKVNANDLVVACSLDDCIWYRAKVIKTEPLEVFYIDFGNTSTVEEIREIPEDLKEIPYLCKVAQLAKPEGVTSWSAEAEKKFSAICEATYEFDCEIISKEQDNKPCVVKLSVQALGEISTALIKENDEEGNLAKKVETETNDLQPINDRETVGEEEESFFEAKGTQSIALSEETPSSDLALRKTEESPVKQNEEDLNQIVELKHEDEINTKITAHETFDETTTTDLSALESEKSLPLTDKDEEELTLAIKKPTDSKKTERTPLKVKSLAEIKANAKPRIVTRSVSLPKSGGSSKGDNKLGRSTPSPVHKAKNVDSKKLYQPETNIRRSASYEDKIIPGCVAGYIEQEEK